MESDMVHDMYMRQMLSGQTYQKGGRMHPRYEKKAARKKKTAPKKARYGMYAIRKRPTRKNIEDLIMDHHKKVKPSEGIERFLSPKNQQTIKALSKILFSHLFGNDEKEEKEEKEDNIADENYDYDEESDDDMDGGSKGGFINPFKPNPSIGKLLLPLLKSEKGKNIFEAIGKTLYGKGCDLDDMFGGAKGDFAKFMKENKGKDLTKFGMQCKYYKDHPDKKRPKNFHESFCETENLVKHRKKYRGKQPTILKEYTKFAREMREALAPGEKISQREIAAAWHKKQGTTPKKRAKSKRSKENFERRFKMKEEKAHAKMRDKDFKKGFKPFFADYKKKWNADNRHRDEAMYEWRKINGRDPQTGKELK